MRYVIKQNGDYLTLNGFTSHQSTALKLDSASPIAIGNDIADLGLCVVKLRPKSEPPLKLIDESLLLATEKR